MDHEFEGGRRRLPRADDRSGPDVSRELAAVRRDEGVRRTRQVTRWTAAALIAGLAASSGYFVHAAATPPAASAAPAQHDAAGVTGHQPSLSHPVATSGGSGVTAGGPGRGGGTAGSGGTVSTGTAWRDN